MVCILVTISNNSQARLEQSIISVFSDEWIGYPIFIVRIIQFTALGVLVYNLLIVNNNHTISYIPPMGNIT
jgi:hypothetical protein